MVAVKYIGPGRYGTMIPKQIWTPGEVREVSSEVAEELLQDPYFVRIKKEQATKAPSKRNVEETSAAGKTGSGKRKAA
jgi:hypothetical protein